MANNRLKLRELTYAHLEDRPILDKLGAAITDTSGLTFTPTTGKYDKYYDQAIVEIGGKTATPEICIVNSDPLTNTITVFERGDFGSTAATHLINTLVRINPEWFAFQLNSAFNNCLKRILKPVVSATAVTITASKFKYDLPAAIKGDRVLEVMLNSSDSKSRTPLRKLRFWDASGTAGVDEIEFSQSLPAGRTIWIRYLAGHTAFSDDTTDCDLPDNETAQMLPTYWAAYELLMQKESPRLRKDRGQFKKSSPPLGGRINVAKSWLDMFVQGCIACDGIEPDVPEHGQGFPHIARQSFIWE